MVQTNQQILIVVLIGGKQVFTGFILSR